LAAQIQVTALRPARLALYIASSARAIIVDTDSPGIAEPTAERIPVVLASTKSLPLTDYVGIRSGCGVIAVVEFFGDPDLDE
jgi:hypothetical protein